MSQLFGVIFVVGLIYSAGRLAWTIVRACKRTANTTGVVVRVKLRGWNPRVPCPDVEFLDHDGIRREFQSTSGASWNPWPVGRQVKVSYDPNDPVNAELAFSEISLELMVMLIFFGIFLAFIGLMVITRSP